MTIKELEQQLENDFVAYTKEMDKAMEEHNADKAGTFAGLSCYICTVLGRMWNMTEDHVLNKLYDKYNLHKYEQESQDETSTQDDIKRLTKETP